MTNYKTLEAWKKSMLLVKDIYLLIKSYPKEEQYNLSSQTKRAAVSVPSNIAEGMGRNHKRETIQFLHIARGSLYELETLLNIASMLNMIDGNGFKKITDQADECQKILNGLILYFENERLN